MWVAWIRHQRSSTPALVEQPFDRPRAGPGQAVLDLLHLLGDMDVDRPVRRQRGDGAEFLRRHRAQAVRRDADDGLVDSATAIRGCSRASRAKPIEIVDESPLAFVRRGAAEAGMRVEHRQQRQADAGLVGRGGDALGHLGEVGIGRAVAVVMQVVELADAGEAASSIST